MCGVVLWCVLFRFVSFCFDVIVVFVVLCFVFFHPVVFVLVCFVVCVCFG